MKARLLTCLTVLAATLSGVAHAAEPPPYVRFTLNSAQVPLPELQVGQQYAVYISWQVGGFYAAVISTLDGKNLYDGVPVRVGTCDANNPYYWPDLLDGAVMDSAIYDPDSVPSLNLLLPATTHANLWLQCPKSKDEPDPGRTPTPGTPRSTN